MGNLTVSPYRLNIGYLAQGHHGESAADGYKLIGNVTDSRRVGIGAFKAYAVVIVAVPYRAETYAAAVIARGERGLNHSVGYAHAACLGLVEHYVGGQQRLVDVVTH